jgi:hypothetical protein
MNQDKLELLERQLAEKVTERVRPALFRLYASVGVAVIAALGFVSWDIVTDIKDEIKTEIAEEIAADIKAKRGEILELVTETRLVARQAHDVIQSVENQLKDFEPQAENLDQTIEKVKSLNVRSQDFLAIYEQELKPLASTVESLSNQLRLLAEQVDQLNAIVPGAEPGSETSPAQTPQIRAEAIQSVISKTEGAKRSIEQARNQATVFFQFAGGRREQAEELSAILKSLGYIIPGEDREEGAANKHEVRYFHDDDGPAAERLAKDTTEALRDQGYNADAASDVVVEPYVTYGGKKPRPGVLELWLEIPAR